MTQKQLPSASSADRFINRELSWLAFNQRVLEEALNPANPLLERLNFLAISASNIDEFFMVRVAGLKDYVSHDVTSHSIDGLLPVQELALVEEASRALCNRQHDTWVKLRAELEKAEIHIVGNHDLSPADKRWLRDNFRDNYFPVITPIAIDPAHPFPFLPNLGLAVVLRLAKTNAKKKREQMVVIPLPNSLKRFIQIPGKKLRFIALEDVVELCLDRICPGFTKITGTTFRIIRDSELDLEDQSENFVRSFERAVKQRRRGRVIRVKYPTSAPKELIDFVNEQLQVDAGDAQLFGDMLGLSSLKEIFAAGPDELKFLPFKARFPERIDDYDGNCLAAIAAKDIVVHHPFETFDVVLQFLRQAAADPDVVSIKQTLYRTSSDSPIIKALIEAAEAGKSVTALVELKARFDEEANLQWGRDLERAGVQVVYGFVQLKTHAKVTLVTRREAGKLVSYVHFGTGNYHPNTARLYTDLSYFTCDPVLCRDAAYLFNFITGYAPPTQFKKIIVAPDDLRKKLLSLIKAEIRHANAGRKGAIWAKMNALVDPTIIDALYAASQAGVQIDLIIRGICCLRPGVKGLSENIRVKSIIGRFLEHSRIFCFGAGHGLPSPEAKVYISSADWMPRNFDRRVEAMVPIENPTVHQQVLDQIMNANIKDEKQSWVMHADGSYERLKTTSAKVTLSAHEYFMTNPSLSGRGKALKKGMSTQITKLKPVRK